MDYSVPTSAGTEEADAKTREDLAVLGSKYKNMTHEQLASAAVDIAVRQLTTSADFKKPRLATLEKYWRLYDGKTTKKLRQLFNVPIPVFSGMVDTLNAQYDTPIQLSFKEGDASDYFKVQKINGAFQMEVMNTAQNSKWDSKLSMVRKHAIMNGIGIPKLTASSDPEYKSDLEVVNLKHFHFQPRGGLYLENHLFAGEEDIEITAAELAAGALSGEYNVAQSRELLSRCSGSDYLPQGSHDMQQKLMRFRPLGLNPDNHDYVGQQVFKLAQWIITLDGKRYLLLFHPWTRTWLRFERWTDVCGSDLYPWRPYTTHEDDENLLSKSYGDDMYAAADAVVALFNQELTNREKRNFGARAYDKDMFTDVRKLDESMHRPDALVPADTKNGARPISDGIFEFKVGELQGTVNLIDWINATVGRNTGATDLSQGNVQEVSKKASVTFAEQKAVSKRLSWGSQPFQNMMADLGRMYVQGLKDHMPARMAIRLMGEAGWDWDEITRLDLSTTKDVDVLINSTDKQQQESELRAGRREKALTLIANSPNINSKKRDEEVLRSVGEYDDAEVAEFMDTKTYSDRKSLAKASQAIDVLKAGKRPELWYGATIAFMQKIIDVANDKRTLLGPKFDMFVEYAMAHKDIVRENIARKVSEEVAPPTADQLIAPQQAGGMQQPQRPAPTGIPGGVQHAMDVAEAAI